MAKKRGRRLRNINKNQRNNIPKSIKIANFYTYRQSPAIKKERIKREILQSSFKPYKQTEPTRQSRKNIQQKPSGFAKAYTYDQQKLQRIAHRSKKERVCHQRDRRRVTLFQTGNAGKGIKPNKQRVFTDNSKINCRR